MPLDARRISFRPLAAADLDLIAEWVRRPHWRQWWGEPDEELRLIRDMVEGRDTTRPYLILVDGKPEGYIQLWYIGDNASDEWVKQYPWLAELSADTVGVDLSLADGDRLSRGIGSAALRAFVDMLRQHGHDRIVIDPDPANARAVRAYEKTGFRPVPGLLGRTGDALIMQFEANEMN
jgi:aminoglycoside 6'-N-acetyltransferase